MILTKLCLFFQVQTRALSFAHHDVLSTHTLSLLHTYTHTHTHTCSHGKEKLWGKIFFKKERSANKEKRHKFAMKETKQMLFVIENQNFSKKFLVRDGTYD